MKSRLNDSWRQAWLDLDLGHGLTPANVLQPRPELEAGMVRAVLAGDAGAFAAVQRDYGTRAAHHRGRAEVDGGRSSRGLPELMASAASITGGATL